jgi:hypothetical protein
MLLCLFLPCSNLHWFSNRHSNRSRRLRHDDWPRRFRHDNLFRKFRHNNWPWRLWNYTALN